MHAHLRASCLIRHAAREWAALLLCSWLTCTLSRSTYCHSAVGCLVALLSAFVGGGARYSHSLQEMPENEDRGSAGRKEVQRAAKGPLETTGAPMPVWIVITTSMIRYFPRSVRIFESWS